MLQILPLRALSARRNVFVMATREQAAGRALDIARRWDAGESGCGALIMGLKRELQHIEAGELLQVTARDAGAMFLLAKPFT